MSNLKYYTPSIEEFHVGFEYEVLSSPSEDKWKKCKIRPKSCRLQQIVDFGGTVGLNDFRVKYLDKDDIESLGFYETKLKDSNEVVYLKDVNQGFNTGYTVALSINHNSFVTISYKSFSSYMNKEYSIDVIIKNKSELARLLKQLNIQ